MKHALALLLLLAPAVWGDAGVLIPSGREKLDPSVVTLQEMNIDVLIDNGNARVRIRQIYASHYGGVLEGDYIFALPGRATISDFAVWDGVTRIPGVILERRRAEEIYADLKWQAIDPGLLQQGERDADEARRSQLFSARIVPIPAYGSKRVEIEYHERLPVEDLESFFAIPLRPDAYRAQTAGLLSVQFELRSEHPLRDFQLVGNVYPFAVRERTATSVKGGFEARNIALTEDFAVRYALAPAQGDALKVLAHRQDGPGFFEAALLMNRPPAGSSAPRTAVLLFDTSLSMQWEKLERSFQALETILRSLGPADRFNLLLFNSQVESFAPAPVTADTAAVEKALAFVKASRLRGGTNLQAALDAALKQSGADTHIVLLGDGGATRGAVQNGKLAAWYEANWKARRPHTYIFAVGDDANLAAAENAGALERHSRMGPLDRADRLQAQGLRLEDRPAAGGEPGPDAGPAGEFRHGLSASGQRLRRVAGVLGGPVSQADAAGHLRGGRGARSLSRCPSAAPNIRTCRAPGRGRASTRCLKRSSARAKTPPPSTRSSAFRASTSSSRRTRRSWPRPARCCARA